MFLVCGLKPPPQQSRQLEMSAMEKKKMQRKDHLYRGAETRLLFTTTVSTIFTDRNTVDAVERANINQRREAYQHRNEQTKLLFTENT